MKHLQTLISTCSTPYTTQHLYPPPPLTPPPPPPSNTPCPRCPRQPTPDPVWGAPYTPYTPYTTPYPWYPPPPTHPLLLAPCKAGQVPTSCQINQQPAPPPPLSPLTPPTHTPPPDFPGPRAPSHWNSTKTYTEYNWGPTPRDPQMLHVKFLKKKMVMSLAAIFAISMSIFLSSNFLTSNLRIGPCHIFPHVNGFKLYVDFKKWLCRAVEFKGSKPLKDIQQAP